MLLYKKDGNYDIQAALHFLIEKYGTNEPIEVGSDDEKDPVKEGKGKGEGEKRSSPRKRKAKDEKKETEEDDEEGSGSKKKPSKAKKSEMYTVPENKPIGEAIYEMGGIYFKNNDGRKGGVFSKAAKAIREADFQITSKKEAMSLPGVGKGIAEYIVEFLEKGSIEKLEMMRAGMA